MAASLEPDRLTSAVHPARKPYKDYRCASGASILDKMVLRILLPFLEFVDGERDSLIPAVRLMDGRKLRIGRNPACAILDPSQNQGRVRIDISRPFLRLRNSGTSFCPPITPRIPIKTGRRVGARFRRSPSNEERATG